MIIIIPKAGCLDIAELPIALRRYFVMVCRRSRMDRVDSIGVEVI